MGSSNVGRIEGQVAVITGAASGIGLATAQRFSAEGATVAGLDLQKPVDEAAWNAVMAAAPNSSFQDGLDVRDESAVAAAIKSVIEQQGRIDILVNAAGVGGGGPTHELAVEVWDRVVDINLKGCFLVSKHVFSQMVEQRSGSVIHLASVEGLIGISGNVAYNASKGGVVLMTKSQALDYAKLGIRVNCVCPGLIETPLTAPFQEPALKHVGDQLRSFHAMDRLGRPDEIAACALFLASEDASFVTGTALVADGGWTAGNVMAMP